MIKELTKEDVIKNKKQAIRELNNMLESFINDPSIAHLKKANLISYWIKDYVNMINFEESFDPTRNIAYKRGNIVKLNFGFNIGCEYGGLHYAVVLDNKNDHNSPVVTVIPLTSVKNDKEIHANNVDLGNEIYRTLKLKYDTITKSLNSERKDIEDLQELLEFVLSLGDEAAQKANEFSNDETNYIQFSKDSKKYYDAAENLKSHLVKNQEHNKLEKEYLDKIGDEISKMKSGSIALVSQITTISKIRIFDPRNLRGVLSGVSLSPESMDKINEKVKELYIF